jgi:aryl-alcohol dehydrogenase-like predicted oxidoreductase
MPTRRLGTSELKITPVGIGAWAIGGGGWNESMGPQNERDSVPAIHAAFDHGLNWIDWPEPDADIEEGWSELVRLQKAGKVRYIGVSNFSVFQMKRAQAIAPVTSLEPPYSIVTRQIEKDILPFTVQNNIGVIVDLPMSAGLLTGAMAKQRVADFSAEDWRRNLPNFQEPLLSRNLKLVERLREIGNRHGRSPGEVAIAWTLDNAAVTGAIVGFRSAQPASEVVAEAEFRLLAADMAKIEEALTRESAAEKTEYKF